MAEGDAPQNQGQGQQSDQSKEIGKEAFDQKKADRTAKERERRRRRRHKKAELKRLERDTLHKQQGVVQQNPSGQQPSKEQPKKPQASKPPKEKFVQARTPQPKNEKDSLGERPTPRLEEDAARSQNIIPQAQPAESFEPQEVHPQAELPNGHPPQNVQRDEEDVMTHKTHSFSGPLIQPGDESKDKSKIAPLAPEVQRQNEPPQEIQPHPELPPEIQPQVQPFSESREPESQKQAQPEPEQPSPTPTELHQQPDQVPQMSPDQNEDIVINPEHEKTQPQVDMHQVEEELPPLFPTDEPQHHDEPAQESAQQGYEQEESRHNEDAEEVHPIKSSENQNHPEEAQKVHEQEESSGETLLESESKPEPESHGLEERTSFFKTAAVFFAGVLKSLGGVFHNFRLKFDFRKLLVFVVLVFVGAGLYTAYLFKLHEKISSYVARWFTPPPPIEIHVDNELLDEWGITTALIFGDNRGSIKDLLPVQLFDAYYFGLLGEPRVQGETGITPAYYFGTGADIKSQSNAFIGYINDLRALVSAYDVDVYKMLSQTVNREQALDDYQASLNNLLTKSQQNVKEIGAEIDDLKVSYDSLNADKSQSESDFFTALQGLAAQKSNFLLETFIDVSQKQTALKAREAALSALLNYYNTAIENLQIRINSIKQNHPVLVQGIHVINIPGANLNIILPDNQS